MVIQKQFGITLAAGVIFVAALVGGILYMQRGAHIELRGQFLKVRTAPLDANSSIVVVDFRFLNPADYPFVVRNVSLILEDNSGAQADGSVVSEADTKRLFDGVPLLGQKYNPTLIGKDKVLPHATEDRMVAAHFDMPEAQLEKRKRLIIRIEDVDGPVSDISER